jgi:hypothetical protein
MVNWKLLQFTLGLLMLANLASASSISANTVMDNDLIADLQRHQKLWRSQDIQHYQYTYNKRCFCPLPAHTPTKVFVKDRTVIAVADPATEHPIEGADLAAYPSIEQLFAAIEEAIARKAEAIEVTYDLKLGYPTQISIDYIKLAADDEISYSATDLVPLK